MFHGLVADVIDRLTTPGTASLTATIFVGMKGTNADLS